MEFSSVVECGRTYLKTEYPGEDDYRLKMLAINNPLNIVPIQLRMEEGKTHIYFNITDVQGMMITDAVYRYKRSDYEEIFDSIEKVCTSLEEYLLPFEDLILRPENVFKKKGSRHDLVFLYMPGSGENGVREFVEYLLDLADYKEESAVKCVYALYQKVREKGFDLNGLRQSIREYTEGDDYFAPEVESKGRPAARTEIKETKEGTWQAGVNTSNRQEHKDVIKNVGKIIKEKFSFLQGKHEGKSQAMEESMYAPSREEEYKTELLSATTIRGGVYALRSKSSANEDILLLNYPYFIGKDKSRIDHSIEDASVSRYHARIDRNGENFYITDLNSTNGSFLNRIRLKPFEKTEIKEGDSVIFSHHEYEFCFLY